MKLLFLRLTDYNLTGAFLIPYLIMFAIGGVPLFFMELVSIIYLFGLHQRVTILKQSPIFISLFYRL